MATRRWALAKGGSAEAIFNGGEWQAMSANYEKLFACKPPVAVAFIPTANIRDVLKGAFTPRRAPDHRTGMTLRLAQRGQA
jgi:hypothetical protein